MVVEMVRTVCPDCHKPHSVDRRIMGAHLWNCCAICLRAEDTRRAEALASRGLVLIRN